MVAVWVVVGVLVIGIGAAAIATRRHGDDVEPSVREFTEFRDAISRQVAGVDSETRATRRHLDREPEAGRNGHVDQWATESQPRS
jgi:RNA-splicing ligase RtcB